MPKQSILGDSAEIYQPRKTQTEKEKLRDMPLKKKLTYLWEYYKIHALISIAAISLASYIIYNIVTPDITAKLYVALANNSIDEQVLLDYQNDFTGYLQLDPKTENVIFNNTFFINAGDYSMSSQQVLSTLVAAEEIDVFIAPESVFESYAYNGYMDDLSEQMPTDLYSVLTDSFYISSKEEDTKECAYGIYLTNSDLYKNNAVNTDPYVLGIIANAKHRSNAIEFVRYLFQLFP